MKRFACLEMIFEFDELIGKNTSVAKKIRTDKPFQ